MELENALTSGTLLLDGAMGTQLMETGLPSDIPTSCYNVKYPGLEVFIFYEGERIHDINTLFKWGKVKHGSTIMIAIAGEEIKDLAKLQRYLKQGASPAFEAFLRFPVNTVLNLF